MSSSEQTDTVMSGLAQHEPLHLTWEQDTCTLAHLDQVDLPRVVKVHADDSGADLGPLVDPQSPLLVYSKRRRTKVYAECLKWNARQKRYAAHGDLLEIPKDYAGWFEILGNQDVTVKERRPHTTIQQVAESGCEHFLLRTQAAGFHLPEGNDITAMGNEVLVYPGEILRTCGTETRKWKLESEGRQVTGSAETRFLRCHDYRERDILLPYAHPGEFRSIVQGTIKEEKSTPHKKDDIGMTSKEDKLKDDNNVYQMEDILQRHASFPLVVRLVFGWPPCLPAGHFEGVLRLLGVRRPDTLVMHPLVAGSKVLLEAPMDMAWRVTIATQTRDQLKDNDTWRTAINMCYHRVFPFVTCIKPVNLRYRRHKVNEVEFQEEKTDESENLQEKTPKPMNYGNSQPDVDVEVKQKSVKNRRSRLSLLRPKSMSDKPPEEQEKKPRSHSMFAPPMDMATFNSLQIYPALTQWRLADSWTISFTDPASLWQQTEDDVTTAQTEASGGASLLRPGRTGQRRKQTQSVMLTMGQLPDDDATKDSTDGVKDTNDVAEIKDDVTVKQDNEMPDLRPLKQQGVLMREAKC